MLNFLLFNLECNFTLSRSLVEGDGQTDSLQHKILETKQTQDLYASAVRDGPPTIFQSDMNSMTTYSHHIHQSKGNSFVQPVINPVLFSIFSNMFLTMSPWGFQFV